MACCVNVDVMAAKRQKNSERDEKFELMGVVDSTYFCTEDYGKRKKYRVKNLVLDLTPNGPRSLHQMAVKVPIRYSNDGQTSICRLTFYFFSSLNPITLLDPA